VELSFSKPNYSTLAYCNATMLCMYCRFHKCLWYLKLKITTIWVWS